MLMVLKLGLGLLRSRGSAIWLLSEIKKWKMNKWIIGPLCSSKHLLDAKYDEFFSFAKFLWQSLSTLWSLKAKRANLILDPELAWQKVQRGKYQGINEGNTEVKAWFPGKQEGSGGWVKLEGSITANHLWQGRGDSVAVGRTGIKSDRWMDFVQRRGTLEKVGCYFFF